MFLFDSFDINQDNSINFKEFALGMSRLTRGSLQEKIELMFQVLDVSRDESVSVSELMHFVDSVRGHFCVR